MDLKEIVCSTPSPNKKNKAVPSVRFTLSSFKRSKDDDEENLNQINVREKVMDYSEKVREMNKSKTSHSSKPSELQEHPYDPTEDLIEEYYLSDSTDNFVTSYQRYRDRRSTRLGTSEKERKPDEENNQSLDYSLTSEDCKEETKTESSVSDYYSAGKTRFFERIDRSTIDLASDFQSYRDQIENASDDSIDITLTENSENGNPHKEIVVSNYNKLLRGIETLSLTDIRGVIRTQRENILQRTREYDSSSSSDF